MNQNWGGPKKKEDTVEIFSKINISTRRKLYKIFKIDFELFEYDAEKYLK